MRLSTLAALRRDREQSLVGIYDSGLEHLVLNFLCIFNGPV